MRSRLLSLALILPLPLLAAAPPRVQMLEQGLDDDPRQVQRLPEPAATDSGRWDIKVRRLLASAMLDDTKVVGDELPGALAEAQRRADHEAACLLAAAQVPYDRRKGSAAQAEAAVVAALSLAKDQPWCQMRLELARGRMHIEDGRIAQALPALQRTLALAESNGEDTLAAESLSDLAWTYQRSRDGDTGIQRALEAGLAGMRRLQPQKQRFLAATLNHNLAGVYLAADRPAQARQHAEQALALAQAIGDTLGGAYIGRMLARLDLRDQRPAQALERFTAARAVFAAGGQADMEVVAATGQAEALLALHRPQQALDSLNSAEGQRQRSAIPNNDLPFHAAAMEAHAALGDAAATAAAARAWANAQRKREDTEGRRTAAELRERFETERTAAENRRLREREEATHARLGWLVATLVLAALLVVGLVLHVLQQRRLREQLRTLAERDELTGLPNRRSVLATAQALYGNALLRSPVCLALLDIDHFKRVNDRYGHEVGDSALKTFARACSAALRTGDCIGRVGGEEFLLLLPGMPPEGAVHAFERIRRSLRESPVAGMPESERLSFSMGCVALEPSGDLTEAIRRADVALYRAKSEGRDRLALAT